MLAALQSPQPPPTEAILTALLNEITTVPDHFILVLDDYHVIDAQPVSTRRPSPFCSSTCRPRCTWSSPPVRIRIYPWPGCAPAAN